MSILAIFTGTGLALGAEPAPQLERAAAAAAEVASVTRATRLPASGEPLLPADTHPLAVPTKGAGATNSLRLSFRGAPLSLVLDYLSDAAGFVINQETEVRGTLDVWSTTPVSKDEAVDLLNSALKKNGYAVIRDGRILSIVRQENARTSDLEIVTGNDPETVAKSDETVTQLIPVRYANAGQLVNNLQPLLPATATLSVNESANTLLLVATKRDIRRVLKIVSALDTSIAKVSTLKVFPLHYADAKQLATVLQQLFSSQGSSQNANQRAQLFNGPGPGPGGFGPPGFVEPQGSSSSGTGGNAAAAKVVAVADETSNSLIVSSPAALMDTTANIVQQIDQPVTDITELRVFHLLNADPRELAGQLAQLFPDDSKSGSEQNQAEFRVGGFPPPPVFDGGNNTGNQTGSSERAKKKGRVLAVADARTSSLLVSAATTWMPQIAQLIEQLDASAARKELVQVYELRNAEPQDINQMLQDLFHRNTAASSSTSSRNSLLGDNNPLTVRQTQQQNSTSGNPTTGNNRGGNSGPAGIATGF
ncbi:MAG TPA: secretin N-terminal domain-containing protein [Candidatus Binatia bacterium]|nr:secretin N-terminal domain-containing protein [Candidatus Binatia bacterium]